MLSAKEGDGGSAGEDSAQEQSCSQRADVPDIAAHGIHSIARGLIGFA